MSSGAVTGADASADVSTSLPLPLGSDGGGVEGATGAENMLDEGLGADASCHAGIVGFAGRAGVDGPLESEPRVSSKAFSDLSS